ncbi:Arabinogalactan peptide 20 like [Actinidia chinensis var. chinensis]|uniref:Arabinogalactan peptide 20 like n=1 Tax=Actinidia chinensis var. chinensis TaxID=1590841 RepID=A0A2R6Q947_ACTCC|nr:Arabinogalactan peptide 20 like [Actinidia chinensis var. chinensis]
MEVTRASMAAAAMLALIFAVFSPAAVAQSAGPAPAPTSDGTAIDQGIAYVLMLLALVLTYIIH